MSRSAYESPRRPLKAFCIDTIFLVVYPVSQVFALRSLWHGSSYHGLSQSIALCNHCFLIPKSTPLTNNCVILSRSVTNPFRFYICRILLATSGVGLSAVFHLLRRWRYLSSRTFFAPLSTPVSMRFYVLDPHARHPSLDAASKPNRQAWLAPNIHISINRPSQDQLQEDAFDLILRSLLPSRHRPA